MKAFHVASRMCSTTSRVPVITSHMRVGAIQLVDLQPKLEKWLVFVRMACYDGARFNLDFLLSNHLPVVMPWNTLRS